MREGMLRAVTTQGSRCHQFTPRWGRRSLEIAVEGDAREQMRSKRVEPCAPGTRYNLDTDPCLWKYASPDCPEGAEAGSGGREPRRSVMLPAAARAAWAPSAGTGLAPAERDAACGLSAQRALRGSAHSAPVLSARAESRFPADTFLSRSWVSASSYRRPFLFRCRAPSALRARAGRHTRSRESAARGRQPGSRTGENGSWGPGWAGSPGRWGPPESEAPRCLRAARGAAIPDAAGIPTGARRPPAPPRPPWGGSTQRVSGVLPAASPGRSDSSAEAQRRQQLPFGGCLGLVLPLPPRPARAPPRSPPAPAPCCAACW